MKRKEKHVLERTTLGTRGVSIFGVGRRPTHLRPFGRRPKPRDRLFHAGNYKDLTENGNRARRVSGSQGRKGLY